ncbi:putative uncharacterized protein [Firmicutes bacterium CAG:194]|nr:putative uncharacterized protein [Firmicutes bacterium CAG:194]
MSIEHLDIYSEHFDDIVEDIKQRNLSRNNMPKIIVGTGLSLVYGVPGMKELAVHLSKKFEQSSNEYLKQLWEKYSEKIKVNGLEAGLANVTENELVEAIKPITAQFILENEEKLHETIYRNNTGFYKLLQYLKGTVSVDKRIIDIMTPIIWFFIMKLR